LCINFEEIISRVYVNCAEQNKVLKPSISIIIYCVIIIIIIIITISFMQGIYPYIPETNQVPKQHNVTAILSLLFMVPISLVPVLTLMYFYIIIIVIYF
jgi:magnesium-transporting ATPase (P-type)